MAFELVPVTPPFARGLAPLRHLQKRLVLEDEAADWPVEKYLHPMFLRDFVHGFGIDMLDVARLRGPHHLGIFGDVARQRMRPEAGFFQPVFELGARHLFDLPRRVDQAAEGLQMQHPTDQVDHDDCQHKNRHDEEHEGPFIYVDPQLPHDDRHQRIDIGADENGDGVLRRAILNDQAVDPGRPLGGGRAIDRHHDGDGKDRNGQHGVRDDLQQPVGGAAAQGYRELLGYQPFEQLRHAQNDECQKPHCQNANPQHAAVFAGLAEQCVGGKKIKIHGVIPRSS